MRIVLHAAMRYWSALPRWAECLCDVRVRTRCRDARSSFCAEHRRKAKTGRFRGTMGRRCVAAGWSNTHSDSISMHKFPKDPELRQKWEKQVQRTREQWSATDTSVLCSEHFEADCFEVDSMLAEQMGLKKRKRLKPDAVPTVFVRHGIPKDAPLVKNQAAAAVKLHRLLSAKGHKPAHLQLKQVVHQRREWLLRREKDLGQVNCIINSHILIWLAAHMQ